MARHLTSDCYFYGEKEVKGGWAERTEASRPWSGAGARDQSAGGFMSGSEAKPPDKLLCVPAE